MFPFVRCVLSLVAPYVQFSVFITIFVYFFFASLESLFLLEEIRSSIHLSLVFMRTSEI